MIFIGCPHDVEPSTLNREGFTWEEWLNVTRNPLPPNRHLDYHKDFDLVIHFRNLANAFFAGEDPTERFLERTRPSC